MTLIEKFKQADFLGGVCMTLIYFVAKKRPAILNRYVQQRALEVGSRVAMGILDAEGIAHCARCPRRFGMRKVKGVLLCEAHLEIVPATARKESA